ncbi:MAG: glycosyltransferase [Acidobacteriota bacterium]
MRVAHLIHGLGLGGAQRVIELIVRGRSDDVDHIVVSCHGGVFVEPIRQAGATIRLLPRRIPKLDPLWMLAMARCFRRDGVDVVHGHLFGDTLHGYAAARRVGRTPMIMTLHNTIDARSGLQQRGYRWLLGRPDTVPIACADFVRTSFVDAMGSVAERVRAIPNGIEPASDGKTRGELSELGLDLDRGAGDSPGDGTLVLATVGRMAEQKAYPMLFDALDRLRADEATDWRLVMFGDGPLRVELEALAEQRRLADRIVFAGFRDDVPRWLSAVDAIVFSSIFEGLPMALLEALAAGTPVVSTRVGGIPDVLTADDEALLVPPRDPAALADAIRRLGDPALRQRLGDAGRRRFEAELTARRMVERYETLYRETLDRRRATRRIRA